MNEKHTGRRTMKCVAVALLAVVAVLSISTPAEAHGTPMFNGTPRVVGAFAGNWRMYHFMVPNNARRLEIRVSGGFGDANLYARHVSGPWVPVFNTLSNEARIVVNNPRRGHWDIRLHAARGLNYGNAALVVRCEGRGNMNWGNLAGNAIHAAPGILHGIAAIKAAGRHETHIYHHRDDDDDDDRDRDRDRDHDRDRDRNRDRDRDEDERIVVDTAPVADRLAVTSPRSGASLVAGRTYPVRWQAPARMRHVVLEVSWNTGRTWNRIATVPARTPGFVWHVAADQRAAGLVILRVSDADNPANSSAKALAFSRR